LSKVNFVDKSSIETLRSAEIWSTNRLREERELKKNLLNVSVSIAILGLGFWALASAGSGQREQFSSKRIRPFRLFSAQTNPEWMGVYGNSKENVAYSIVQADNGGYVVAGFTREYTPGHIGPAGMLIEVSPKGKLVWQKAYNTNYGYYQADRFYSMQKTSDGRYIAAGRSWHGPGDSIGIYIAKFFSNGEPEWSLRYGDPVYGAGKADCIRETDDGGYIFVGPMADLDEYEASGYEDWDLLVVKISAIGKVEWWNMYGGKGEEADYEYSFRLAEITQTSDGGYLLASETQSFGEGSRSFLVIKISSIGTFVWANTYGGEGMDVPSAAGPHILETDHNTYIVGCSSDSFSDTHGILLLELDLDGSIIKPRLFDTNSTDSFNSIISTTDGGYMIAGTATIPISESYHRDFMLLKLTSSLDLEWAKTYGADNSHEISRSVKQTQEGGYVIAGIAEEDICVLKVSADGNLGGPGCADFIRDPVILVSEPNIVPMVAAVEVDHIDEDVSVGNMDVSSVNLDFTSELICWNLNQPPLDVSFEEKLDRSYFWAEPVNKITWQYNPLNDEFTITEYRIYRKDADKSTAKYELIATVPGNIFEYEDFDSELSLEGKYLYVVTSVDSDGNESPRSNEVGNTNQ